jgi:hypothetical protein
MMPTITYQVAKEEIEKRRPLLPEAGPRPAEYRLRYGYDEDEKFDDPNSLFWRGVWITVF